MPRSEIAQILMGWAIVSSVWTFALFGYDKWRAARGGRRVTEATLWWVSALGGWPGGLLGIVVFRHKQAKWSFLLMFAAAFLVWGTLAAAAVRLVGN